MSGEMTMCKQEEYILKLLRKEPLSLPWIVFRTHLSPKRVYKLLSQLHGKDLIRSYTGKDGLRRYHVWNSL